MENDVLSRIQQRKSNLLPLTTIFRKDTTAYTIHLFEQIYNSRSKKDTNLINKYEYHTYIYMALQWFSLCVSVIGLLKGSIINKTSLIQMWYIF